RGSGGFCRGTVRPLPYTRRTATSAGHDVLWTLNCQAYREVVIRQFGAWDDAWQRRYFDQKGAEAQFEVVEMDGEPMGAV
ncbi:MAG: hypothetical protein AAF628_38275, partial [Planctomycetota bacterium]